MRRAAGAGAVCFAIVFAVGFVLGTVRTLVLRGSPGADRLTGVLIELPIILAASWLACAWVIRQWGVAARAGERAVMGAVALVLLLLAEFGVSAVFEGRGVVEHVALYAQASYLIGLMAQVLFGAFPLVQLAVSRGRGGTSRAGPRGE